MKKVSFIWQSWLFIYQVNIYPLERFFSNILWLPRNMSVRYSCITNFTEWRLLDFEQFISLILIPFAFFSRCRILSTAIWPSLWCHFCKLAVLTSCWFDRVAWDSCFVCLEASPSSTRNERHGDSLQIATHFSSFSRRSQFFYRLNKLLLFWMLFTLWYWHESREYAEHFQFELLAFLYLC